MATRMDEHFAERRADTRSRSVLALGKIVSGGREHICIVRDISAGGLKVEMVVPLDIGTYVIVEMLGLNPTPARIAWRVEGQVGLAFSVPQDFDRMCRRGADGDGSLARGPRFTIDRVAKLAANLRIQTVSVSNISAGGARLTGTIGLAANMPVHLTLQPGQPLAGYVRWVEGDAAGISFTPALDMRTLLDAVQG
jgi:hypothetical protein